MSAIDTLLGFTRMIAAGWPYPRTARVLRWGTGFGVEFDAEEQATVTFSSPEVVPHWRTLLNVNFLTGTSLTISGDDTVLVDGSWLSFVNQANVHSTSARWSIATGTGLIISANASGTLFSAGTLPELRFLLSSYALGRPLRCRVRDSSCYGSTDVRTFFGLRWVGSDPAYCAVMGTTHDAGAGIESVIPVRTSDGGTVAFTALPLGAASESGMQNVLGLTMPLGAGVVRPMILELSDSIFGGWGVAENALMRSVYFDAAAGRIDRNFYGINNAWPVLALGAEFTTHSTSSGLVIEGIRVDQFY
jgi:hypothetical protein